jgi:hypothetical protein
MWRTYMSGFLTLLTVATLGCETRRAKDRTPHEEQPVVVGETFERPVVKPNPQTQPLPAAGVSGTYLAGNEDVGACLVLYPNGSLVAASDYLPGKLLVGSYTSDSQSVTISLAGKTEVCKLLGAPGTANRVLVVPPGRYRYAGTPIPRAKMEELVNTPAGPDPGTGRIRPWPCDLCTTTGIAPGTGGDFKITCWKCKGLGWVYHK